MRRRSVESVARRNPGLTPSRWRGRAGGLATLALVLLLAGLAYAALRRSGLASGFDFLGREAGVQVGESAIAFTPGSSYGRAILVGVINTCKATLWAGCLATVLGTGLGFARLSRHPLLLGLAGAAVELLRNIPVLLQLLFWYTLLLDLPPQRSAMTVAGVVLSNRGLRLPWPGLGWPERVGRGFEGGLVLTPEFAALVIGLSLYTAVFVAEIVRGAVQSVPRGPLDAARALGLRPRQVARLVTLPLALRVMVPSLASEYVGLVKNTSLAVAIGYTELVGIMRTTIEQTNQAVDGLILLVLVYGALNGALAAAILGWGRLTAFTVMAEPTLARPTRAERLRALVAGPWAVVATVLLAAVATWFGWRALRWGVLDAVGAGGPAACRAASGACWAFVIDKAGFFLFGFYPPGAQWRPAAACVALCAAVVLAARLRLAWGGSLVLLGLWLMRGGWLLEPVATDRWGGLALTLVLAVTGIAAGLPLGVGVALARTGRRPALAAAAALLVEVVRALPLVALLEIASLLLPLLVGTRVDRLLRAEAGLVLFAAVFMGEAVRGGLRGVPDAQAEAARALGLSSGQALRLVVLPQALRVALPALANNVISFFKDTSLVIVLGLFDLLSTVAAALRDPAWQGFPVEGYLFVALVYFGFCAAMSAYARRLERAR